ncbi:MAG: sugar phosphate isomerase/epimerase family protein [Leucobacter sp.]
MNENKTDTHGSLPELVGTNFGTLWTQSLADSMVSMREAGFAKAEVVLCSPICEFDDVGRTVAALLEASEFSGVSIVSLNTVELNLISPIELQRKATIAQLTHLLEAAQRIGVETVVTVPGRKNVLSPMPDERALPLFRDSLRQLIPVAERTGVRIALENAPFGFLESPSVLMEEAFALSDAAFASVIDAANLYFSELDFRTEVNAVAPVLRLAHVSDTDRVRFRHDYLHEGGVNFSDFASALTDSGYRGPAVYELVTPGVDWNRVERDLRELRSTGKWA